MHILEKFIYTDLNLYTLYELLAISDSAAEYINYISEFLQTDLLIFTYCIVARRLGIYCIPRYINDQIDRKVNYRILWKSKYNSNTDWYNVGYFYMREQSNQTYPSNMVRGRYIRCSYEGPLLWDPADNIRTTRAIMIYCFQKLRYPDNQRQYKWIFNIFFNLLSDCSLIIDNIVGISIENTDTHIRKYKYIMQTIEVKCENIIKEQLKKRTKRETKVKFNIGMIVTHSWELYQPQDAENTNHQGVIIAWHDKCDRTFRYELQDTPLFPYLRQCHDNYHICKCKKSSDTINQPHYIILTDGNRICYVQEDHISICSPKRINNIEIGRYFSKFEGTHYVPNKSLVKGSPFVFVTSHGAACGHK
ncbi:F-box only protein 21 [Camponotus japonicus]